MFLAIVSQLQVSSYADWLCVCVFVSLYQHVPGNVHLCPKQKFFCAAACIFVKPTKDRDLKPATVSGSYCSLPVKLKTSVFTRGVVAPHLTPSSGCYWLVPLVLSFVTGSE